MSGREKGGKNNKTDRNNKNAKDEEKDMPADRGGEDSAMQGLYDALEGLQCVDIPAFSVQYHPEAAAGPHDAAYLFDRFVDLMRSVKEGTRNA